MKKELCPECHKKMEISKYFNEREVIMKCKYCHKTYKLVYDENDFPDNINSFNWGAFFLWRLWGFWNGMPILSCCGLLLCFLTHDFTFPIIIEIPIALYMGVKGSKLSWRYKEWESTEIFKTCQYNWSFAGISLFFCSILFGILCFFAK